MSLDYVICNENGESGISVGRGTVVTDGYTYFGISYAGNGWGGVYDP